MNESTRYVLRRLLGCLMIFVILALCGFIFLFGYIPYNGLCVDESAAHAGNLQEQMFLSQYYAERAGGGLMLYQGRFAPSLRKSEYWMRTAAKSAAFQFPGEYEKKFAEIPNSQFMNWYEDAANQGNFKAAKRLCDIYTYGQFGQPRDPTKAAHWRDIGRKLSGNKSE